MKKLYGLAVFVLLLAPALFAQEHYTEGPVWRIQLIRVKPTHMDEYLTSVRELEQRLARSGDEPIPTPDMNACATRAPRSKCCATKSWAGSSRRNSFPKSAPRFAKSSARNCCKKST